MTQQIFKNFHPGEENKDARASVNGGIPEEPTRWDVISDNDTSEQARLSNNVKFKVMDSMNVWNMRENQSPHHFSQTVYRPDEIPKKNHTIGSKGKLLKLASVPTQSVLMRSSIPDNSSPKLHSNFGQGVSR